MFSTDTTVISCPYCGESFEIVVDCSIEEQSYIEDCFVCCRPIDINVHIRDDGDIEIQARHENA